MTTPEAIRQATERMFAFCNANQVADIIDVNHGCSGTTLHLRLEDFERVFRGREVTVTYSGGYDRLCVSGDGFDVIALRCMPMALGSRVEVMP